MSLALSPVASPVGPSSRASRRRARRGASVAAALAALATTLPAVARAEAPPASEPGPAPPAASAAPAAKKPAPFAKAQYALPYLLRPLIVPNVLRLDMPFAINDPVPAAPTAQSPSPPNPPTTLTWAPSLTFVYRPFKAAQDLGVMARAAFVYSGNEAVSGVANPMLALLYTPELAKGFRVSLFGAMTVPVGQGGGDKIPTAADPTKANEPIEKKAMTAGIWARQAMDNALFATNYLTSISGWGVGIVERGWTVQAEATILYLLRVRGEGGGIPSRVSDGDDSRTNFTIGANLGYLVANWLTASFEVHYQAWLSDPALLKANPGARSQATLGGGLRGNFPLGGGRMFRPGLAYFHPLDDPMAKNGYRIIQLDLPFLY
jgi:hypothetical protein